MLVEANRLVREARDGWAANAETSSAASRRLSPPLRRPQLGRLDGVCLGGGAPGRAWVAASIGPFGAALADSSEYQGEYGLAVAALTAFHRERLDVLAAAQASPPTSVDVVVRDRA
ncbi:MAG: homocysteine S-methyltransferase family protein [Candidatus Microthrix sp.]|nr:homocysteine S-methyltransferase family protein [Candidatus Microthrix sp.]MBK6502106.1 homocysteine S-methyltransferase family protein [Candidatus Microthrix sp.]